MYRCINNIVTEGGSGDTLHFRFMYGWDVPDNDPDNWKEGSYNWWKIDMLLTGDAVLPAKVGAPLGSAQRSGH